MPDLHVAPEALVAAAVELDALAARLEAAVALNSAAIRVLPSGSEEVSLHAAGYFNTVASTFTRCRAGHSRDARDREYAPHPGRVVCRRGRRARRDPRCGHVTAGASKPPGDQT